MGRIKKSTCLLLAGALIYCAPGLSFYGALAQGVSIPFRVQAWKVYIAELPKAQASNFLNLNLDLNDSLTRDSFIRVMDKIQLYPSKLGKPGSLAQEEQRRILQEEISGYAYDLLLNRTAKVSNQEKAKEVLKELEDLKNTSVMVPEGFRLPIEESAQIFKSHFEKGPGASLEEARQAVEQVIARADKSWEGESLLDSSVVAAPALRFFSAAKTALQSTPASGLRVDPASARTVPAQKSVEVPALNAPAPAHLEKGVLSVRDALAPSYQLAQGVLGSLQGLARRFLPGLPARPAPSRALGPAASEGIPLGHMISFLRSVTNLPESQAQDYRSQYSQWFDDPEGLPRAMKAMQSKESLSPARLDTTIYYQAGEKDDAVVELINNGIDTLLEKKGFKDLVGRFGVGAFQIFQELEEPGDQVILETASKPGQVLRVVFSIEEKADPLKIGDLIKVRLEKYQDQKFKTGTWVRVEKSRGLSRERQESLQKKIASKLSQNSRASILVNGTQVNPLEGWKNTDGQSLSYLMEGQVEVKISKSGYEVRDQGLGMEEKVILEKYLLPRRSTKAEKLQKVDEAQARTQTSMAYWGSPVGREGTLTKMKVVLAVSGVKVEEFEIEGLQVPEKVVIELPSGSWLPESRNKIAVNAVTWEGLKGLLERVLDQGLEENIGLVNALAAVMGYLENPRTHPESAKTGESFSRYLQERLDKVPGLRRIKEFEGAGRRAYSMELKDKEKVYLEYGRNLIFDKEIYQKYRDFPLLLNLLLNFYIGYGEKKTEKGRFVGQWDEKEKLQAAADAIQGKILKVLEKEAWYKELGPVPRQKILDHLRSVVERIPQSSQEVALGQWIGKLREVGGFMEKFLPDLDWMEQIRMSGSKKILLGELDPIVSYAVVGDKLAFWARKKGSWHVYLDGIPVVPGDGFDQSGKLEAVGDKLAFSTWKGDSYHVYLDGKRVETQARFSEIGDLTAVGGKLAFSAKVPGHWLVYLDGIHVILSSGRGATFDEVDDLTAVGGKLAFSAKIGNRWQVYLDGKEVGPKEGFDEIESLAAVGDKLAFSAFKRKENLREVYLDGEMKVSQINSGIESGIYELKDIGSKLAFVVKQEGVSRPHWYVILDWEKVGSAEGFEYAGQLTAVGNKLAFLSRQGYRWHLYLDGKDVWTGEKNVESLRELTVVGDHLAFWGMENNLFHVYLDGDIVWKKEEDEIIEHVNPIAEPLQALGSKLAFYTLDVKTHRRRVYLDGKLIGPLEGFSELAGFTAAGDKLMFLAREKEGWFQYEVSAQEILSWETKALKEKFVQDFSKSHAYDLEDPEHPWGARYLSNLLGSNYGSLPLQEVQLLLPFLEKEEVEFLEEETVREFWKIFQKEPWLKIQKAVEFMKATKGLAQDKKEWNRWTQRWLTIVQVDWNRALELLSDLQKNYPIRKSPEYPILADELESADLKSLPPYDFSDKVAALFGTRGLDLTFKPKLKSKLTSFNFHDELFDVSSGSMFDMAAQRPLGSSMRGFEFLKAGSDIRQAPGHLRGYLYYLKAEKAELLKEKPEEASSALPVREKLEDVPLALLTLAKRQRGGSLAFNGLGFKDYKEVLQGLEGYSIDGIEEEIRSAISGQEQGENLWIRELIQNSRDAIRKAWREGRLLEGQGEIIVESYKRGPEWVVEVKDPAGMSVHILANYFFPLDESEKVMGQDAGRFGQGLYTLFGDFDEVRIKTSMGDGHIQESTVIRDKQGRLKVKSWEEKLGSYRGTEIRRIKRLDRRQEIPVELEAAFVTHGVYEYGGSVQNVKISYQGERINDNLKEKAFVDVGNWGKLRILESPSRLARITQDELPISDPALQAELLELIPDWMGRLWSEKGWSLDLPKKVPLVRSRAGLAQKEKVLSDLQKAIMAAGVRIAVQLYFEEGLKLPGLPEDFYYWRYYDMDDRTKKDAQLLNAGRWSELDWAFYSQNGQALGKLMALTTGKVGEKTVSPWQVRKEILSGQDVSSIFGARSGAGLAESLKDLLKYAALHVKEEFDEDSKPQKNYTEEEVLKSPSLRLFQELNFELLRRLGEKEGWKVRFYHKEERRMAHFGQKTITWNLYHAHKIVEDWSKIVQGKEGNFYGFFYKFLETFVHEYTHFTDGDWSHHSDEELEGGFAWRMKRNIEKLLRSKTDLPGMAQQAKRTHAGAAFDQVQDLLPGSRPE